MMNFVWGLLVMLAGAPEPQPQRAIALHIMTVGESFDDAVEPYLRERAARSWRLDNEAPEATFFCVITWLPQSREIEIVIARGDAVLTRRQIAVDGSDAAKATLWLILRSSLRRALTEAPAPPVASVGVSPKPASDAAMPKKYSALLTAAIGSADLASLGFSLGVQQRLAQSLLLSLTVGYLHARAHRRLRLHQWPLKVGIGIIQGDERSVAVGLLGVAELKYAHTEDAQRWLGAVQGGMFMRAQTPLGQGGVDFLWQLAATRRLQRYIYRLSDSSEAREEMWQVYFNAGVAW